MGLKLTRCFKGVNILIDGDCPRPLIPQQFNLKYWQNNTVLKIFKYTRASL